MTESEFATAVNLPADPTIDDVVKAFRAGLDMALARGVVTGLISAAGYVARVVEQHHAFGLKDEARTASIITLHLYENALREHLKLDAPDGEITKRLHELIRRAARQT